MLRVRIKNFQSIEDSSLIVRGLTAVRGNNNVGKSAIIRAVKSAVSNVRGSYFVRYGAEESEVEIDDGDVALVWTKGKGGAQYKIGAEDFKRVSGSVPDEIVSFGIREIICGGESLWPQIASQFTDLLFLVNKTGAVLAEALADVVRIGALSNAQSLVKKDLKKELTLTNIRSEELAAVEFQLQEVDGVEALEEHMGNLLRQLREITKTSKVISILEQWQKEDETQIREILLLSQEGVCLPEVPQLQRVFDVSHFMVSLFEDLRECQKTVGALLWSKALEFPEEPAELSRIFGELEEISSWSDQMCSLREMLSPEKNQELSSLFEMLDQPEKLMRLKEGLSSCKSLFKTTSEIRDTTDRISEQRGGITKIEKALMEVEFEISSLEKELGICPLCGSSFDQ